MSLIKQLYLCFWLGPLDATVPFTAGALLGTSAAFRAGCAAGMLGNTLRPLPVLGFSVM